jgi:Fur family ferric uptake transcriptional regulator
MRHDRSPADDSKKFPAGTEAQSLVWMSGLKATKPRIALVDLLLKEAEPTSAAGIHARLGGKTDLATVYRMLGPMVETGLVAEIKHPRHEHSLYELSYGRPHHHHAVCTKCGDMEDIGGCVAEDLNARARGGLRKFRSIQSHSLEFFGLCRNCERK